MGLSEKILKFLDQKVNDFGAQYKVFGLFVVINYPLSYLILYYIGSQTNESSTLRLIAFLLSIPLIFTQYWTIKAKKYLSLYWFLTILYSLPFLATYMLLQNQMSTEWLMNIILGLFLLILLVDWTMFVILLSLGVLLGFLCFVASGKSLEFDKSFSEMSMILYMYIYAIIIGLVFSRSHERSHQEKLHAMKMLAGSIAHELRTPLSAMMMGARAFGKILPSYQEAYTKAKAADLLEDPLDQDQEGYIANLPKTMQTVSQNAHTMITMLLANLNEGESADYKEEPCSIALCIEEALHIYPFSKGERRLVHWRDEDKSNESSAGFTFLGHKELIKHVLFNLFKNTLYAIGTAGKGEIFITIEPADPPSGKKTNRLIFKDTGPGIPPENLRHIFDRFYTKTEHGTGIGLAFCQSVMQRLGGQIMCTSLYGEHTTFTLSFPVIREGRST